MSPNRELANRCRRFTAQCRAVGVGYLLAIVRLLMLIWTLMTGITCCDFGRKQPTGDAYACSAWVAAWRWWPWLPSPSQPFHTRAKATRTTWPAERLVAGLPLERASCANYRHCSTCQVWIPNGFHPGTPWKTAYHVGAVNLIVSADCVNLSALRLL